MYINIQQWFDLKKQFEENKFHITVTRLFYGV